MLWPLASGLGAVSEGEAGVLIVESAVGMTAGVVSSNNCHHCRRRNITRKNNSNHQVFSAVTTMVLVCV